MSDENKFYRHMLGMVLDYDENKEQQKNRRVQRKLSVLSNAEKQKRFRERMKAEGYRRVITWVKDDDSDSAFKRVETKIHKTSIGICERNDGLRTILTGFLKLLGEQAGKGYFPREVCRDIAELCKPLGIAGPGKISGQTG